jgi:hypothetical protein
MEVSKTFNYFSYKEGVDLYVHVFVSSSVFPSVVLTPLLFVPNPLES